MKQKLKKVFIYSLISNLLINALNPIYIKTLASDNMQTEVETDLDDEDNDEDNIDDEEDIEENEFEDEDSDMEDDDEYNEDIEEDDEIENDEDCEDDDEQEENIIDNDEKNDNNEQKQEADNTNQNIDIKNENSNTNENNTEVDNIDKSNDIKNNETNNDETIKNTEQSEEETKEETEDEEDNETEDEDSDDDEEENEEEDEEMDEESEEDEDEKDEVLYASNSDFIKQANTLLKNVKKVTKTKKILTIKTYLTIMNNRFLMSTCSYNSKKSIYYNETLNSKFWTDENKSINYSYNQDKGAWYIVQNVEYSSEDMMDLTEAFDNTYIYDKENDDKYNGHDCYVLEMVNEYKPEEEEEANTIQYYTEAEGETYNLYIDKKTYEIRGIMIDNEVGEVELSITYPDRLEIPKTISNNAHILPGTTFTSKKIKYKVYENNNQSFVKVIGYTGKNKKIVVPDTVKYKNIKIKVTTISKNAFINNKKITSLIIGKNIKTIQKKAFYNCSNLKTINIKSDKIKSIGKYAFKTESNTLKFTLPRNKKKKYKKMINKSNITTRVSYS